MSAFGESQVRALIDCRTTRRTTEALVLIREDFTFRLLGMDAMGRDEFVSLCETSAALTDVRVEAILVSGGHAAAFFVAKDPITMLTHRIAWLVEHRQGSALMLTEVRTIIDRKWPSPPRF